MSAGSDGNITFWNRDLTHELFSLHGGPSLQSVACSKDGWRVGAVTDRGLQIWNAKPGFDLAHGRAFDQWRARIRYVDGLYYGDSKELLAQARELDPDAYWHWQRALGQTALDERQFAVAIRHLTLAVEGLPREEAASAWDQRGLAHQGLRQFAAAIADFTKAIEIGNTCSEYYVHRAGVSRDIGRLEESAVDWMRAVELSDEALAHHFALQQRDLCHRNGNAPRLIDAGAEASLPTDPR